MLNAIKNYINACAEAKRPCNHNWELIDKSEWVNKLNSGFRWFKFTYRCKNIVIQK